MKNSFKSACLAFLTTGFVLSMVWPAASGLKGYSGQQQQAPPPLTIQLIKGGIYMVMGGSGANTGFFIGPKEVMVIDAKMTEDSTKQLMAEIAKLTPHPVTTILITHSDGDHVNGLTGFPAGLAIVSHPETKRYMDEAFKDEKLRAYLPNKTFSDRWESTAGPKKIEMLHFGPAHTSGDAVVFFPEEKVVFVGDLLFMGRDPLIHKPKNGTSIGLVKNLKAILALDADTFIPGHGEVAGRSELEKAIGDIEGLQAKVKAMIAGGKTLDEIKKAFGVEDGPSQPGRPRRLSFVEVVYQDLTDKK